MTSEEVVRILSALRDEFAKAATTLRSDEWKRHPDMDETIFEQADERQAESEAINVALHVFIATCGGQQINRKKR